MDLIVPNLNVDNEEVVDYEEEDNDIELPIDINSCLLLNNVYIESIDELKQYLVSKRRENECRQQELKNNSGLKTIKDPTINNYGYSHPNSLIPFMAPYFKDVKGLTAPHNEDAIEKRLNGEMNESYVCSNKSWNVLERQRLKDILQNNSIESLHKPLRDEKERLTKDKKNLIQNMDKINDLTEKIDSIGLNVETTIPNRWEEGMDWLKFATELDTDHTSDDCELYWNNFLHPSVNKTEWTKEEDKRLEELVSELGLHDWDIVAEELGTGRLGWQVCARYQSELNRDLKRVGPLSKAEAETVEKVISSCRVGDFIPWHQIKYFIEGRTLPQIKHYWNKINVAKRGDLWSEDENKVLTAAVKKFGIHNWRKVAQYIPGRSNRQCRERYMMRLNFGADRKLGNWTAQEDRLILDLAPKHEFHWVKLEDHIKGRNARQIASRYELLIKYKSKGKDFRKMKNKFGNKSCFATRTLTVRNRVYEKIRQMINRNNEQNEDLDQILRIGRAKLAKKLEMEAKGITTIKGRPKKTAVEEDLDAKIVELFASYDHKSSPKKSLSRGRQDQCVYDTTKQIIAEQLMAKPFESDTELAKAIRLLIERSITCRSKEMTETDIATTSTASEAQTSHSSTDWIPPPILPPNRTTVKGLRGLLLHTDYFSQIISKSNISFERLKSALESDQNYAKLFAHFKSLFCWPALLSMIEPPERQTPTEPVVTGKGVKTKQRKSWLKTESSRMVQIRTNQKKLIQSEMQRNADNKIEEQPQNDEPLSEGSTFAPWYVTQRDRKYYSLKSLDKNSFVFTRVKPKHESIESPDIAPKRGRKRTKTSDEIQPKIDETVDSSLKPIKKRNVRSKKAKNNENVSEMTEQSVVEQRVTRRMTRSRAAADLPIDE